MQKLTGLVLVTLLLGASASEAGILFWKKEKNPEKEAAKQRAVTRTSYQQPTFGWNRQWLQRVQHPHFQPYTKQYKE